MSNFPLDYDNDVTLPAVSNNITEIGEEAINAIREAVLNIENNIGLGANGSESNIASRLDFALNSDGSIKTSVLTSSGLVTLPILNSHVSDSAGIKEYKLDLDYKTSDLFNYITDLSNDVNSVSGWINTSGVNLNPHLSGLIIRHKLNHIDVSSSSSDYFRNKFQQLRDNTDVFTVLKDLNDDVVSHQRSDGFENNLGFVSTVNGEVFPANYGHTASAIFIDTSRFSFLPQVNNDVQKLVNYLDSSSIFLYGTRIQNLYSNGISRVSRSSSLLHDGYGSEVIPETTVTAYFFNDGLSSSPLDDILIGDDIIRFYPSSDVLTSKKFHNQFSSVRVGDILRINYGGAQTSFIVKEKKYINNGIDDVFIIRINGKNIMHTINGSARIDRPLVNENKYATLNVTPINNDFSEKPSLLIVNPRCAQTLGNGFNANNITSSNYMLYLALFPTGKLEDGYILLPGIDVTGNLGSTPGKYTLDSVIAATNKKFRSSGYNYRFVAFSCNGEFGIAMTDSVNNAGFSIISGTVDNNGIYSQSESQTSFPNNVLDLFSSDKKDPLGIGPNGSASASPPYQSVYGSSEMALVYTKLFLPLKRNTYYTNGAEKDNLQLNVNQIQDSFGDGYWVGEVIAVDTLSNRVKTTYRINLDLSQSKLDVGSTILVKSSSGYINDGRFIIESININCPPNEYTEIVVYDSVHGNGYSPITTLQVGSIVNIYSNLESVSFNESNSSDYTEHLIYKRLFETYVDENGFVFNHERLRYIITGANTVINEGITLVTDLDSSKINILSISPKLYGYVYGSVNKITLHVDSYNSTTSTFQGYLCNFDGYQITKAGPTTIGKRGSVIRLYDYSLVDYIDFIFDVEEAVNSISNKNVDIQLFPSMENNKQIMILSTCQLNDVTKQVTHYKDKRQFGNISEENLSTSALNYISAGDRLLHTNGVFRGFNYVLNGTNVETMSGGVALVNGKIVQMNSEVVVIPAVKEIYDSNQYDILFALCLNEQGQYVTVGLLDQHEEFNLVTNEIRSIQVYNPISGQTYSIECDTFENIVNKRKDLLILYLVYVSGNFGTTIDTIDVRRYSVNSDASSPLVYTKSDNFGNFKKASAMFAWLQYNNNKNYCIYLSDVSEIITDPILIDYNSIVTIDGRNSTTLTFNSGSYPPTRAIPTIGSNVVFKNTKFTGSTKFEFLTGCENIVFENCDFSLIDNSTFELTLSKNVKFINCIFDIDINSLDPVNILKFTQCSDIHFDGCNFISVSSQYGANLIAFVECDNVSVTKSKLDGDFTVAINLYKTSNVEIEDNIFDWYESVVNADSYQNDSTVGLRFTIFSSTNIVNVRRALIYSNVTGNIENIIIRNNKMSYTHNSMLRFGFISFELTSVGASLINSQISNNKFYHTYIDGTEFEPRSAICFSNDTYMGSTTTKSPKLVNVSIDHNYCNRDQLIIICNEHIVNDLTYPGISTQNVSITHNTCGTISYLIATGNPNIYQSNERISNLLIDSNNCRLITNMQNNGTRWYAYAVSFQPGIIPLGTVVISNNIVSWISISAFNDQTSSVIISKNTLQAYKYSYLTQYGYDGGTAISQTGQPTHETGRYAIRVTSLRYPGTGSIVELSPCVITDNVISQGTYLNAVNAFETYYYEQGFIYTKCRSVISNNVMRGIDPSITNGSLIFVNGFNSNVTSNIIHGPDPGAAFKYVFVAPAAGGYVTSGLVKDNHFYNSNTGYNGNETFISVPTGGQWRAYENINQVSYATVPLVQGLRFNNGVGYGPPAVPMMFNSGSTPTPQYTDQNTSTDFGIATARSNTNVYFGGGSPTDEWYGAKSDVARVRFMASVGFGSSMEIGFQQNIKSILPIGCRIKSFSVGVRRFGSLFTSSGVTDLNTRLNFSLYQYIDGYTSDKLTNLDRFADGYSRDLLVPLTTSNNILITASDLNGTNLTVEKTVNVDIPVSTNQEIILSVDGHLTKTNNSDKIDLFISPIVIKYSW